MKRQENLKAITRKIALRTTGPKPLKKCSTSMFDERGVCRFMLARHAKGEIGSGFIDLHRQKGDTNYGEAEEKVEEEEEVQENCETATWNQKLHIYTYLYRYLVFGSTLAAKSIKFQL